MIRTGTATQALVLLLLGYVLVAGEPPRPQRRTEDADDDAGLARHASVVLRAATARGPAVAVRALRQARSRAAVPRQHDPDAAGHIRARAPSGLLPAV